MATKQTFVSGIVGATVEIVNGFTDLQCGFQYLLVVQVNNKFYDTTQPLYCGLVCLFQTLLLCRILSLVHTQLLTCQSQYIVIVMQTSTLVGEALSHYVIVSVQVNTILTHIVLTFYLGNNIHRDCVVDSGNTITLTMGKLYVHHVLYLIPILSPFLFIPSLYSSFFKFLFTRLL